MLILAISLGSGLGVEGSEYCCTIDGFECPHHICRLVRLHGCEHRRCLGGLKLFKQIGRRLRVHFIEDIARMIRVQILEQVNGAFFIKSLENVSGVVWVVFSELLPRVMVGVEILLGFLGPPTSEITQR